MSKTKIIASGLLAATGFLGCVNSSKIVTKEPVKVIDVNYNSGTVKFQFLKYPDSVGEFASEGVEWNINKLYARGEAGFITGKMKYYKNGLASFYLKAPFEKMTKAQADSISSEVATKIKQEKDIDAAYKSFDPASGRHY